MEGRMGESELAQEMRRREIRKNLASQAANVANTLERTKDAKKKNSDRDSSASTDLKELSKITAEIDNWDDNGRNKKGKENNSPKPSSKAVGSPKGKSSKFLAPSSAFKKDQKKYRADRNYSELSLNEEMMTDLGIIPDASITQSPSFPRHSNKNSRHPSGASSSAQEEPEFSEMDMLNGQYHDKNPRGKNKDNTAKPDGKDLKRTDSKSLLEEARNKMDTLKNKRQNQSSSDEEDKHSRRCVENDKEDSVMDMPDDSLHHACSSRVPHGQTQGTKPRPGVERDTADVDFEMENNGIFHAPEKGQPNMNDSVKNQPGVEHDYADESYEMKNPGIRASAKKKPKISQDRGEKLNRGVENDKDDNMFDVANDSIRDSATRRSGDERDRADVSHEMPRDGIRANSQKPGVHTHGDGRMNRGIENDRDDNMFEMQNGKYNSGASWRPNEERDKADVNFEMQNGGIRASSRGANVSQDGNVRMNRGIERDRDDDMMDMQNGRFNSGAFWKSTGERNRADFNYEMHNDNIRANTRAPNMNQDGNVRVNYGLERDKDDSMFGMQNGMLSNKSARSGGERDKADYSYEMENAGIRGTPNKSGVDERDGLGRHPGLEKDTADEMFEMQNGGINNSRNRRSNSPTPVNEEILSKVAKPNRHADRGRSPNDDHPDKNRGTNPSPVDENIFPKSAKPNRHADRGRSPNVNTPEMSRGGSPTPVNEDITAKSAKPNRHADRGRSPNIDSPDMNDWRNASQSENDSWPGPPPPIDGSTAEAYEPPHEGNHIPVTVSSHSKGGSGRGTPQQEWEERMRQNKYNNENRSRIKTNGTIVSASGNQGAMTRSGIRTSPNITREETRSTSYNGPERTDTFESRESAYMNGRNGVQGSAERRQKYTSSEINQPGMYARREIMEEVTSSSYSSYSGGSSGQHVTQITVGGANEGNYFSEATQFQNDVRGFPGQERHYNMITKSPTGSTKEGGHYSNVTNIAVGMPDAPSPYMTQADEFYDANYSTMQSHFSDTSSPYNTVNSNHVNSKRPEVIELNTRSNARPYAAGSHPEQMHSPVKNDEVKNWLNRDHRDLDADSFAETMSTASSSDYSESFRVNERPVQNRYDNKQTTGNTNSPDMRSKHTPIRVEHGNENRPDRVAQPNANHHFSNGIDKSPHNAQNSFKMRDYEERLQYERNFGRTRSPSSASSHSEPPYGRKMEIYTTQPGYNRHPSPHMMNGHSGYASSVHMVSDERHVSRKSTSNSLPRRPSPSPVHEPKQHRRNNPSADSGIGLWTPNGDRGYDTIEREIEESIYRSESTPDNVNRVFVNGTPTPSKGRPATSTPVRSSETYSNYDTYERRSASMSRNTPSPSRSRSPAVRVKSPPINEDKLHPDYAKQPQHPHRGRSPTRILSPQYTLEKHKLQTEILQGDVPNTVKVEPGDGPTPLYRVIEIMPNKNIHSTKHERESEVLKQEMVETIIDHESDYEEYSEVPRQQRPNWSEVPSRPVNPNYEREVEEQILAATHQGVHSSRPVSVVPVGQSSVEEEFHSKHVQQSFQQNQQHVNEYVTPKQHKPVQSPHKSRIYVKTPDQMPESPVTESRTITEEKVIKSIRQMDHRDNYEYMDSVLSEDEEVEKIDENQNVHKDIHVETGDYLIKNAVDTTGVPRYVDIDHDDNVNYFDQQFFVNRENPLYHSDEDLTRIGRDEVETTMVRSEVHEQMLHKDTVDHVHHAPTIAKVTSTKEETQDLLKEVLSSGSPDTFFYEYQGSVRKKDKDQKRPKIDTTDGEDETFETWEETKNIKFEEQTNQLAAQQRQNQLMWNKDNVKQSIHVDREEEEVHDTEGVLLVHADGTSMKAGGEVISFDAVNETIDLGVKDGIARVAVKVRAERTSPLNLEVNLWKKNAVIVTRLLEFDLTANEETRRMYERLINSSKANKQAIAYKDSHGHDHVVQKSDRHLDARETMKVFAKLMNVAGEKNEFGRHNMILDQKNRGRRSSIDSTAGDFSGERHISQGQFPAAGGAVRYGGSSGGNFSYGTGGGVSSSSKSFSTRSYGGSSGMSGQTVPAGAYANEYGVGIKPNLSTASASLKSALAGAAGGSGGMSSSYMSSSSHGMSSGGMGMSGGSGMGMSGGSAMGMSGGSGTGISGGSGLGMSGGSDMGGSGQTYSREYSSRSSYGSGGASMGSPVGGSSSGMQFKMSSEGGGGGYSSSRMSQMTSSQGPDLLY